ncbi:MAG: hypothetical protein ABH843_03480 [Candidatus Omnitrophota bacterium]
MKKIIIFMACIILLQDRLCWCMMPAQYALRPPSSASQQKKDMLNSLTDSPNKEAVDAIRRLWEYIKSDIEASDPHVAEKTKPFLSRLYHAAERTVASLEKKAARGEIDPLAGLRIMKYTEEPKGFKTHKLDRELRVGYLPIASNPLNWGHILIGLMAMDALNLDFVVYRIQGEIGYKDLPESDRVPAKERHTSGRAVIDRLSPAMRYTDLGSEANNKKEGALEIPVLLELNAGQKIHIFPLVGVETESRVKRYVRQYIDILGNYNILENSNHKLTLSFIQRGEFGKIVDLQKLYSIVRKIEKEADRREVLDVSLIKDPDIDLNVNSTYYRNSHDPAIVPRAVDQFAKEHGYYGHSAIDPRTNRPYASSEDERIRMKLAPIAEEMGKKIIDKVGSDGMSEMVVASIDGGSGSGKTTIADELSKYLTSRGYNTVIMGLDMFLKDRRWRHAVQKLVTGEKLTADESLLLGDSTISEIRPHGEHLDEETFFDIERAESIAREITRFRYSEQDTHELVVDNAYVQRTKGTETRSFQIDKKTIVIIDGKYANTKALQKCYDIRFLLKDNPDRTKAKFEMRTRILSPNDADRQMVFYDLSLVPSYMRYLSYPETVADYIIDISTDEWTLVPFSKSSSAGTKKAEKLSAAGDASPLLYPGPHSESLGLDSIDRKKFTWDRARNCWVHKKYSELTLAGVSDIQRDTSPGQEFSAMDNDAAIRTNLGFSVYVFDSHDKSADYLDDAMAREEVPRKGNIQLWIDAHSDTYLLDKKRGYEPGYSAITIAEKGTIDTHIWLSFNTTEALPDGTLVSPGSAELRKHVRIYEKKHIEGYFSWKERPKNTRVIINICSDVAQSGEINDFLKRLFEEDGLVPSVVHISTSPAALYDDTVDATGAPNCYGDVRICRDVAEFVLSDKNSQTIEQNIKKLDAEKEPADTAAMPEKTAISHISINGIVELREIITAIQSQA